MMIKYKKVHFIFYTFFKMLINNKPLLENYALLCVKLYHKLKKCDEKFMFYKNVTPLVTNEFLHFIEYMECELFMEIKTFFNLQIQKKTIEHIQFDHFLKHCIYITLFIYSLINNHHNIFNFLICNQDSFLYNEYYIVRILNHIFQGYHKSTFIYNEFKKDNIFSNSIYNHNVNIRDHLLDMIFIFSNNEEYLNKCVNMYKNVLLKEDIFLKNFENHYFITNYIKIDEVEYKKRLFNETERILKKNLLYSNIGFFKIVYDFYMKSVLIEKENKNSKLKFHENTYEMYELELIDHILLNNNNKHINNNSKNIVLEKFTYIYSLYHEDQIIKVRNNYEKIKKIIYNYYEILKENIDFILKYFDIIQYDIFDCNEKNLDILFEIALYTKKEHIYEILKTIEEKNKYSYYHIIENMFIIIYKKIYLNLDSYGRDKVWMIQYFLEMMAKYNLDYLNYFINMNLDYNKKTHVITIEHLLKKEDLFELLNDESHIKLIKMIILSFLYKNISKEENDKKYELCMNYLNSMITKKYIFHNISDYSYIYENKKYPIIYGLYKIHKELCLYLLNQYDTLRRSSFLEILENMIENGDMKMFEELFIIGINHDINIPIYDFITKYIQNELFIKYCVESEYISKYMKSYISYKKNYLCDIDEKELKYKSFQYCCHNCLKYNENSSQNYKNVQKMPKFYVCQDCNYNIHESCLFDLLKYKKCRSKIDKCICCQSKNFYTTQLNYYEYNYLLFQKIVKNELIKIGILHSEENLI